MNKLILLGGVLFFLCTARAQVDPDSVNHYISQYEDGGISMQQMETLLDNYFNSVSQGTTRYEKEFQRSLWFWKDRTHIDDNGEDPDVYIKAMQDFLANPICEDNDPADWRFHFDDSPTSGGNLGTSPCTDSEADPKHTAGIITAVYMNPSNTEVILAGAGASGIWRTNNGGDDWINVTDNLRLPALGIRKIIDISKPSEPEGKHLLAITGKDKFHDSYGVGVLKSNDFGETWTIHAIPEVSGKIEYLLAITKPEGETNLVYACSKKRVYVSGDRGQSWSVLSPQPPLPFDEQYFGIQAASISSDALFVSSRASQSGGGGHLWKSNISVYAWTDFTSSCESAIDEIYTASINETEVFEEEFNVFTPAPAMVSIECPPFSGVYTDYEIEFEDIFGSFHAKVPPVIPCVGSLGNELRLEYDLEDLDAEGDISYSFSALIPTGADLKIFLGPTLVNAYTGTASPTYQSYDSTITIPESNDLPAKKLLIDFQFDPPYVGAPLYEPFLY